MSSVSFRSAVNGKTEVARHRQEESSHCRNLSWPWSTIGPGLTLLNYSVHDSTGVWGNAIDKSRRELKSILGTFGASRSSGTNPQLPGMVKGLWWEAKYPRWTSVKNDAESMSCMQLWYTLWGSWLPNGVSIRRYRENIAGSQNLATKVKCPGHSAIAPVAI